MSLETKLMNNDRPAKTSDEVLEVDATDDVAAIYADIRETMAIPFVNLIWRRLALSPEGLRWTWDTMKPLYSDGAVYSEAALLWDGPHDLCRQLVATHSARLTQAQPTKKMI